MTIKYKLSFPNPHSHYAEVEMHISKIALNSISLKMAVWTPGSYLIREFQKNIDFVEWAAEKNTSFNRVNKQDKSTWTIETNGTENIIVRYKTYCFEYSVRTNFVDDTHALINGTSTFLYIEGYENLGAEVEIIPFKTWQHISTSLPQKENNKWVRMAHNIDELFDAPIEIGNHTSYFFDAANVSHELAMYGEGNCDIEKLIADLKKIIEVETSIFGAHPCKSYVFINHLTDNSYGGLEHAHSSVNHITRWSFSKENYQNAISLLAHEYFHLWNVKRIKPRAFIPFNYQTENYTDLLWFFEGVTSYYDDYICYRAGVTSLKDYFTVVEKNINDVLNTPGIKTQTLAEASMDTWLKYYRRNENSRNSQISYYTQGAVVALIFDFIIINATNGEKCFDNVLQLLYSNYTQPSYNGITEKEITQALSVVSGIDFTPYIHKYIHTSTPLDIEASVELIGLELIDKNKKNEFYLGLSTQWKEGKLIITQLDKNYGAYRGGLNTDDEIIAIDGFRINKDFGKIYAHKSINDTINVLISRQGILKAYNITLTQDKRKNYILEIKDSRTEKQNTLLTKWLR